MGESESHIGSLLTALSSEGRLALAFRVLRSYDVDYDALGERSHALGMLTMLLPGTGLTDPGEEIARLGKAWCEMVDADVEYDLTRGLRLIRRTDGAAKKATDALQSGQLGACSGDDARYIVARWHDGAGKINYRCGDMMSARNLFARALDIAAGWPGRAAIWHDPETGAAVPLTNEGFTSALNESGRRDIAPCFDDIASNLLRGDFEANAQADVRDGLDSRLCFTLLHKAASDRSVLLKGLHGQWSAEAHTWFDPRAEPAPIELRLNAAPIEREGLRGLASVTHNLAVALQKEKKSEESRACAIATGRIAFVLGDKYRLAQALHHVAASPELWDRVANLGWQRGAWMARQNKGVYYLDPKGGNNVNEAISVLSRLYDQLVKNRDSRDEGTGVDVDVLRYTARRLAEAYDVAKLFPAADEVRLFAARSLRGAVKAASYRRSLKKEVLPLYRAVLRRHATKLPNSTEQDPEDTEALLRLADEVTGREMLDLLATQNFALETPGTKQVAEGVLVPDPPDLAKSTSVEVPAAKRSLPRNLPGFDHALLRDRAALERTMQARALAAVEIDESVVVELRRCSARPEGPTIFRFVEVDAPHPDTADAVIRRLGAVVIHRGRIERWHLFGDGRDDWFAQGTGGDIRTQFQTGAAPTRGAAEMLWRRFIEPLWPRERIDHLVVIPAPGMFTLPLHVAMVPAHLFPIQHGPVGDATRALDGVDAVPLGALVPLSFSVSATSLVRRLGTRHQVFDAKDDLCVVAVQGDDGTPALRFGEITKLAWAPKSFHIAGSVPEARSHYEHAATLDGVEGMLRRRAEIFVYAGHGTSEKVDGEAEVGLALDGADFITQYGLLTRLRLERNKWTLLNACVSGAGVDRAQLAEVSGFLKAFIAAGAGALTVTLWEVGDEIIGRVAKKLLQKALDSTASQEPVDIVTALRDAHREEFVSTLKGGASRGVRPGTTTANSGDAIGLGALPMVLYL